MTTLYQKAKPQEPKTVCWCGGQIKHVPRGPAYYTTCEKCGRIGMIYYVLTASTGDVGAMIWENCVAV